MSDSHDRPTSTDPRWNPETGGLPERPASCLAWDEGCRLACTPEARHCASNVFPWPSPTAGTITMEPAPFADPFSPAQRVELERVLLDLDVCRERLRKILERA